MTVDNEEKKFQYLDFVEFSLADFNLDDPSDPKRQTDIINKRKWPKERIVDHQVLNDYKLKCRETYTSVQEYLLLLKIDRINRFTTYIPVSKLFEPSDENYNISYFRSKRTFKYSLLNSKKKLFVDTHTLRVLEKNKELNWIPMLSSLYPIRTLGDGNCLVIKFLVGLLV